MAKTAKFLSISHSEINRCSRHRRRVAAAGKGLPLPRGKIARDFLRGHEEFARLQAAYYASSAAESAAGRGTEDCPFSVNHQRTHRQFFKSWREMDRRAIRLSRELETKRQPTLEDIALAGACALYKHEHGRVLTAIVARAAGPPHNYPL